MSELSPLSRVKLKSYFGAVRTGFDPSRTSVTLKLIPFKRPDVSSKRGVWRAVPIVERAIKVLLARR